MSTCIFCEIVAGRAPAHVIWEDDRHLAFLSIFPNTRGFSVLIPKVHIGSYFAKAPEQVVNDLMAAAKQVAQLLDAKLDDVGRTGVMFEGFSVDHLHVKLFPMHGTKMSAWKKISSKIDTFFDVYEGYISSHDSHRADDAELEKLAKKIRES